MKHPSTRRSRFFRALAWALVPGQILVSVPLASARPVRSEEEPVKAEAPKVKVNRTVPKVNPPATVPVFSEQPGDQEIFQARLFEEPLVPVGTTSASENRALAQALTAYLKEGDRENVAVLEGFLNAHPSSPWSAALLTDLGVVYRRTGYISKALWAWEEAWKRSQGESEPRAHAIADVALSQLATLEARLGRNEELAVLLGSVTERTVRGSAAARLDEAKQSLWLMRNRPEKSFRCGPLALARLVAIARNDEEADPKVSAYPSTTKGTSLLQMRNLGESVGLKVKMARRAPGSVVLLPAIVHWKAGHFAAVVKEQGGKYLLQDPTFGDEIWVSRVAIDEESTGSFLVLERPLPAGWQAMGDEEGREVWGKGAPPNPNPNYQTPCEPGTGPGGGPGSGGGGGCPSCSSPNNGPDSSSGMPTYSLQFMMLNLHMTDTPVAYSPPVGPNVSFMMTYNAKDGFQPQIFTYANLGPKWTFNWISYVEDNPSNPQADVNVYLRGGGVQTSTAYDPATGAYAPEFRSSAVIARTSTSPVRYERRLSDGSVEIYGQPNGALAFPRRVFLTSFADPAGNTVSLTYDESFRLVAVADAIGQVTTLSYDLGSDPLKITGVTDPFGRSASFDYNSAGELSQVTDVMGMASQFSYDTGGDFISSLTTPYGTTQFARGGGMTDGGDFPTLQVTDPLGGTERLMFDVDDPLPGAPGTETVVPTGFSAYNLALPAQTTFYWDKRAMFLYPGDTTKARQLHWLYSVLGGQVSGIKHSEKLPLENRVWYAYPGQPNPRVVGRGSQPSKIARVLDDGTSQIYRYEYNALGKVCKATDPMGRDTRYTYGTNNVAEAVCTSGSSIDLLRVEQKNGSNYDLVQSSTYNAKHEPLTVIDAAGQTTSYTYDPQWHIDTVTTPPRAGITENRTTTYTYYPDTAPTGAGRLQTITGPATGATTTYEYDGFERVSRVTDSEGYAVATAYDALDRPTTVTYPDGTYEQTIYNRLDAEQRRDRLGRWSRTFYDPLRRVVATRDPVGRTTTYVWCNCGSLEAIRDGNGNTTSWQQDAQGRVTQETAADASFKTFVYENTTSRLKSLTDARNQTKTYGYALDNKLTSTTYTNFVVATPNVTVSYMDPDNPSVPDPYGRLRLMTDGTGTTRYDYKPVATLGAGSLSSVDGPLANDTLSYTYDELGRVTTRGLSTFSTTSGYDALGRLGTLTSPMGNFFWTYVNTTGRPQTVTYPNSQTTTYTYFPNLGDQRLQQIKHQQTSGGTVLSQFDYTYDAVGNIKTWTQQRGTDPAKVYTLGYDPADELFTATVTGPTPLPVPSRFRYAYDSAGNRSAEELDDAVTGATYNNLNQLTSRPPGGTMLFRGTLSEQATVTVQGKPAQVASDNTFAAQAQVGSTDTDVAVAATDPSGNMRTNTYRVTESGSTTTYTYDANGNLAGDGTRTFECDAENRLTRVTQGGPELARFTYDGNGRRAQKIAGGVTHTYIYDYANIIQERLSTGQTYDYVQGPGIDRPLAMRDQASVVSYYLADHLGSIVQTTSAAAAVTLTREYDPWGNPVQGSATGGYAFTAREWDPETNLYYYRARYYDPKIGRFISEDPASLDGGSNLYSYAENSPTNFVDPSGLKATLYCELVPGTGYAFRHCYLELTCPSKNWAFVVELWGPPRKEDPRSRQGYGRPRVGSPNAARNSKWFTTHSEVTPRGKSSSCSSDCSFEERLLRVYLDSVRNVPPYNPNGPNSNTFISNVIQMAGGETHFPWNAYPEGY